MVSPERDEHAGVARATGYLLDTHTFLWAVTADPRLSPTARELFLGAESQLRFSVASVWEMAIKASLGKLRTDEPIDELVRRELRDQGIRLQPLELEHALAVRDLPFHHHDPFDRILIAQALTERLVVIGCDPRFDAYGIERVW